MSMAKKKLNVPSSPRSFPGRFLGCLGWGRPSPKKLQRLNGSTYCHGVNKGTWKSSECFLNIFWQSGELKYIPLLFNSQIFSLGAFCSLTITCFKKLKQTNQPSRESPALTDWNHQSYTAWEERPLIIPTFSSSLAKAVRAANVFLDEINISWRHQCFNGYVLYVYVSKHVYICIHG